MATQRRFEQLKDDFRIMLSFPHYKCLGFYALLRQAQEAQSRAGKSQLRLVPYRIDELHAIYKEHKLFVFKDILDCFQKDNPPYPLQVMKKAISDELKLRGAKSITEDQFRRVYIVVMDAEKENKDEVQGKITIPARNEVEKILSGQVEVTGQGVDRNRHGASFLQ